MERFSGKSRRLEGKTNNAARKNIAKSVSRNRILRDEDNVSFVPLGDMRPVKIPRFLST
jgi:hypothetical protein